MSEQIVVIKYGGHAMEDAAINQAFFKDLTALLRQNIRFVIAHGGGPQINELLRALNIKSEFINGLRVTDAPTLGAVEMALCGQVNKSMTREFLKNGIKAAGVSGEDGAMLQARRINPELGNVGEITNVNPDLLICLLKGGFMPIVAPLALDAENNPLNVNADTAAGAIAGALNADYFILVSDVPGVLDGEGNLLPELDSKAVGALIASGVIKSGMLPKVKSCEYALKHGVKRAIILDGRQPGALKRFLVEHDPVGTALTI